MNKLSSAEEARLVKAVEEAVIETRGGLNPNEAIQKVAEKYSYTPPFIDVMVGAFNKSKAVHEIMNGGSSFSLASTPVIVNGIYGTKEEKVACEIPNKNRFSQLSLYKEETHEKTASDLPKDFDKYARLTPASIKNIFDKCASVTKAVNDKLCSDSRRARIEFDNAVTRIIENVRPMMDKEFHKMAQAVVNGYPRSGDKLVKLVSMRTGRECPALEKTAFAQVFPVKEPYLSIATAYSKAIEIADSENAIRAFERMDKTAADSFLQDFLANVTSDVVGVGNTTRKQVGGTDKSLEKSLSPDFYNKLKSVEARKNFMDMALYDKDLQKFNFKDLIDSYNSVAQAVPEASEKPSVLRNLMLRNLETGGIKDPFELTSELTIGKLLTDTAAKRSAIEKDKRGFLFSPKEQDPRVLLPKVPTSKDNKPGVLSKILSEFEKPGKPKADKPEDTSEDAKAQKDMEEQAAKAGELTDNMAEDVIKKSYKTFSNVGISVGHAREVMRKALGGRLDDMDGLLQTPSGNPIHTNTLQTLVDDALNTYYTSSKRKGGKRGTP